jgi:hypothetical protein
MVSITYPRSAFCFALVVAILLHASSAHAQAQDTVPEKPGPWHYHSLPCVDTTVVSVTPRLQSEGQKTFTAQDFESSGVQVAFATRLGAGNYHAGIVHYQNTAGNDVMMAERPGDRVQVCFMSAPAPTKYCDPDKDSRGRVYRVYDYRQHASYQGMNSEHDCGGA